LDDYSSLNLHFYLFFCVFCNKQNAITLPQSSLVILLAPEFVIPQDSHEKQDCENAAAKR